MLPWSSMGSVVPSGQSCRSPEQSYSSPRSCTQHRITRSCNTTQSDHPGLSQHAAAAWSRVISGPHSTQTQQDLGKAITEAMFIPSPPLRKVCLGDRWLLCLRLDEPAIGQHTLLTCLRRPAVAKEVDPPCGCIYRLCECVRRYKIQALFLFLLLPSVMSS